MLPSPNRFSVARLVSIIVAIIIFSQIASLNLALAQNIVTSVSPMIFDVRRSLPMEPDEPVFHDFYINAGQEAGFKKGQFITVVRIINVHDPVQNKQQGELQVGVARLQVIHVAKSLTVARLDSEFTDEERPALEFEAVMIGDRIDMNSITVEAPAKKKPKGKAGKQDQRTEMKREEIPVQMPAQAQPPAAPVPPQPSVQPVSAPANAPSGVPQPANAPANAAPKIEPSGQPTRSTGTDQPSSRSSATASELVQVPVPQPSGTRSL